MNSINCSSCGIPKKLTDIVKTSNVEGVYECKPCANEILMSEYDPFMSGNFNDTPLTDNRIKKIMRWCLG